MDWGMMQDPYKVAMTVTGCTPYIPANTVDTDGIMNSGGTPAQVPAEIGNKGRDGHSIVGSPHMRSRPCHHVCLRPRLRFGLTLSALIVVSDAFLRFSWTLRFVTRFPSNDAFVLCTQFLEVFRRAMWNLLRVEWENIKQKNDAKGKEKQDDEAVEEEDWEHSGAGSMLRLPNNNNNNNKSIIQQRNNSVAVPGSVEMKSLL